MHGTNSPQKQTGEKTIPKRIYWTNFTKNHQTPLKTMPFLLGYPSISASDILETVHRNHHQRLVELAQESSSPQGGLELRKFSPQVVAGEK